ncbi:MAG TPA: hypothetical protein VEC19_06170 [Usitatibacter sp.]|nr:hypothetical protein [Usitatibacter sp.]
MRRFVPQENTGRVVGLAVAFFGALALLGFANGVFERLAREELVALAAFASGFATLTYALDDSVRAWVKQALPRRPLRKSRAKSPARSPAAT